jgi:hypothetical protein
LIVVPRTTWSERRESWLRRSAAAVDEHLLSRLERLADWSRDNPALAFTLFGAIVYGVVRLDYGVFYDGAGITPEQAGRGFGETFVQSALITFAFATFALLIVAAAAVVGGALVAVVYGVALGLELALLVLCWAGVLYGAAGVRGGWRRARGVPRGDAFDFRRAARTRRLARRTVSWPWRTLGRSVRWLRADRRRRKLLFVVGIAATTLSLLVTSFFVARSDADSIRRAAPAQPFSVFGVELLDLRASRVRVAWRTGTPPVRAAPLLTGCPLLVGSGDGIAYFRVRRGLTPSERKLTARADTDGLAAEWAGEKIWGFQFRELEHDKFLLSLDRLTNKGREALALRREARAHGGVFETLDVPTADVLVQQAGIGEDAWDCGHSL